MTPLAITILAAMLWGFLVGIGVGCRIMPLAQQPFQDGGEGEGGGHADGILTNGSRNLD